MTGIYIHVPFCAKKCPYCDFFSKNYTADNEMRFVRAIVRDIENFPERITSDTIYFGGGTPSLLKAESISLMLEALKNKFDIISPEVTMEVNPSTVYRNKLELYRQAGINRLSFGVQSANDDELKLLGRLHNYEKAAAAVNEAYSCGFNNISCDIMTGLPAQTTQKLGHTIDMISDLPVTHISSYILKAEPGTPFYNEEFINTLPDDDYSAELYLFMVNKLEQKGFMQYEISNLSKKGYESRHNLKYWHCEEYIGFGPSAHSYHKGKRYFLPDSIEDFFKAPMSYKITDDAAGGYDERIMLGLRLKEGIALDDYPEKAHIISERSEKFIKAGLMTKQNNRLSLTPKGFLVSNSIISDLIL